MAVMSSTIGLSCSQRRRAVVASTVAASCTSHGADGLEAVARARCCDWTEHKVQEGGGEREIRAYCLRIMQGKMG